MPSACNSRPTRAGLVAALSAWLLAATAAAAEVPSPEAPAVKYRVTGLFSADRQEDLRKTIERVPGVRLVGIDYEKAEAIFEYDPATLFAGVGAEQIPERFDMLLRSVSRGTFGIRPLYSGSRDELQWVEIEVVGMDCKGCSLAAYEAIYQIEGVEQATASFQQGLVTAHIDPAKTHRQALETALKAKGVHLQAE